MRDIRMLPVDSSVSLRPNPWYDCLHLQDVHMPTYPPANLMTRLTIPVGGRLQLCETPTTHRAHHDPGRSYGSRSLAGVYVR
ncbi:hypothetical protein DENSPDRAFT_250818 [Dentipellis sp. KUC8613]|nr:hypothetical protein DENSPDRAFT_250818 [Dentipellis sp. KUC8613]